MELPPPARQIEDLTLLLSKHTTDIKVTTNNQTHYWHLTHRAEFLSKFVPPPSPSVPSCVSSLAERMAGRLLSVFVRHAALLRPLGPAGKLQLAKDMGELQLTVAQGLYPLEQLGPPAQVSCNCAFMLYH